MSVDMRQFYDVFFEEAAEHLAAMENLLLNLDIEAPDGDQLNAIFRSAHSMKGGSGMFGFNDMMAVTHELETLLDRVRKKELPLTSAMVDIFLEARDVIKAQLDAHRTEAPADEAAAKRVCEKLLRLERGEQPAAAQSPAAQPAVAHPAQPVSGANGNGFNMELTPEREGVKLADLVEVLNWFGSVNVLGLPKGATAEQSNALPPPWRITLGGSATEAQVRDMLDAIGAPVTVCVNPCITPGNEAGTLAAPDYGLFTSGPNLEARSEPGTTEASGQGAVHGELNVPTAKTEQEAQIASAPAEGKPDAAHHGRRATDQPDVHSAVGGRRTDDKVVQSALGESSSIRVSVEKVDKLINLVGELVITQAMLTQTCSQFDPVLYERLLNGLGHLERNTRDLQDAVMSIRMMPISFVFNRFPRLVRDLAAKLGKQVELKTVGEGTELDKGLIEKITDPLTHLVRNSLDHGIETPEERIAAGKPAKGLVTLRAFHQGGNVIIEVCDDGKGLDREKILAKARERGLAAADALTDAEVWQFIFEAGFSTADVVTDVSGRGVGMDVVKRNIHALGGRTEIDSVAGRGTRIAIRLPLTLAILDGLSVAVGGELFIVPLTYIVESLQPAEEDVKTLAGKGQVVHVRGEYVPLIALHRVFNLKPEVKDVHRGIVVILETGGQKTAVLVDALVGQHQVVIKSLESNYRRVHGVAGATIMGDGRVALILDPVAIARDVRQTVPIGVN